MGTPGPARVPQPHRRLHPRLPRCRRRTAVSAGRGSRPLRGLSAGGVSGSAVSSPSCRRCVQSPRCIVAFGRGRGEEPCSARRRGRAAPRDGRESFAVRPDGHFEGDCSRVRVAEPVLSGRSRQGQMPGSIGRSSGSRGVPDPGGSERLSRPRARSPGHCFLLREPSALLPDGQRPPGVQSKT